MNLYNYLAHNHAFPLIQPSGLLRWESSSKATLTAKSATVSVSVNFAPTKFVACESEYRQLTAVGIRFSVRVRVHVHVRVR